MKKVLFQKINYICFLFFLLSNNSTAQTDKKGSNRPMYRSHERSIVFNTDKKNRIGIPFGYAYISKQPTIDSVLSIIQDPRKSGAVSTLKFNQVIEKKLVSLSEEYNISFPYNKSVNEKFDKIKIASNFIPYGDYSLHFMAVYNTVRYAQPFIEKIYLISIKDNKPIDMMRIYLHREGEMGFADYTLFYIDKYYRISLQDYVFNDDPFKPKPIHQYQVLVNGKFSRYYDQNGLYRSEEEQGLVKNHRKEGEWLEFKSNQYVNLGEYPAFTDNYTYLEATYNNGLPIGKWNYYKLLQEYNAETGEPIVHTRKKGSLIYTEFYENGILEKREFYRDDR